MGKSRGCKTDVKQMRLRRERRALRNKVKGEKPLKICSGSREGVGMGNLTAILSRGAGPAMRKKEAVVVAGRKKK